MAVVEKAIESAAAFIAKDHEDEITTILPLNYPKKHQFVEDCKELPEALTADDLSIETNENIEGGLIEKSECDSIDLTLNNDAKRVALNVLGLLLKRYEIQVDDFAEVYSSVYGDRIGPKPLNFKSFSDFFSSLKNKYPISFDSGTLRINYCLFESWIWFENIRKGDNELIRKVFDLKSEIFLSPESIPEIDSKHLKINTNWYKARTEKKSVEVKIVAVASAARLYIRLKSSEMDVYKLMHQMTSFYDKNKNDYFVHPNLAGVDLYCAVFEDKLWLRAKIIKVIDEVTVEAFLIDCGGSIKTDVNFLRFLTKEFASLPQTAICVSLRGIEPANKKTYKNTKEKLIRYSDVDRWMQCYFYPKNNWNRYSALLIDTLTKKNISEYLIEQKLAIASYSC